MESEINCWCVCATKVRNMYERVRRRRCRPLSAVHAHVPLAVHRRLADAVVHLPVLHGARRRRAADDVSNELELDGHSVACLPPNPTTAEQLPAR